MAKWYPVFCRVRRLVGAVFQIHGYLVTMHSGIDENLATFVRGYAAAAESIRHRRTESGGAQVVVANKTGYAAEVRPKESLP